MHFFPSPYKDEILYSVLARYSVRCGITSYQTIAESIFGKCSARAILELPSYIDSLMTNLPVNNPYTHDEFIYRHTLYPFFTAFLPSERAEDVKQLMLMDGGSKIYGKAGIIGSRIPLNQYLRFCPRCFEDDLKQVGEAYWHRIHQIPFVMACPTHSAILKDSNVLVREHNPQAYFPADKENCISYTLPDYSDDTIKKFVQLAQDAQVLLDNNLPNQPFIWFAKQYLERFKELGYSNINGKVYWEKVIMDFTDFYGVELLNTVDSNISQIKQGRWIREITHIDAKSVHPIHHLLLIKFLGIDIKELFTKEICYKPFGEGPWVCPNPAADHFLEPVVENLCIKYRRRNKNVNGFFSCSCGFEYMKTVEKGNRKRIEEGCKFVRVVKHGTIWEAKVRDLLQSGVSVQETAARMNADPKTIRKYLFYEPIDKDKRATGVDLLDFFTKRQTHRNKWLLVVKENPDKGRLELRRIAKYSGVWLCKNDREWWEKNTPAPKQVKSESQIDWVKRDIEILEHVKTTVREILRCDDKPLRISLRLIKTRSRLKSFDLQLNRLPLTKTFINLVIETPLDLHRRRIEWAIQKLHNEGGDFGVYTIADMIGVGNKYRKDVIEAIKEKLNSFN